MNKLTPFIRPPKKPLEIGAPKPWEKVEARLGLRLPADYKAFIDTYGTGSFNDFLMVYNPFAQNEYFNLFFALDTLHQAAERTQLVRSPAWSPVHPFGYYPAAEGLLPWGCTSTLGDMFFWKVDGIPETWETVFYNLRSGEYEVWKYPMTGFLYRLLTSQIESVLLPADFPPTESPITFIREIR